MTTKKPTKKRERQALTDTIIKSAHKATTKQLTDGEGLYLKLHATTTGLHSWRFDFKSPEGGARKTLHIGEYPVVSLAKAREEHLAARKMIADGRCPVAARKGTKEGQKATAERAKKIKGGEAVAGTFKALAKEFHADYYRAEPEKGFKNRWSKTHADKWIKALENHVFPTIGDKDAGSITADECLAIVSKLEKAGKKQMAMCVRTYMTTVFELAVVRGLPFNPVMRIKRLVNLKPKSKPLASQTSADGVVKVFKALEKIGGLNERDIATKRDLMRMLALVWQRPSNVREMEWAHLDLDAAMWEIPSRLLKRTVEEKEIGASHKVPLPKQAVNILRRRLEKNPEGCAFVFCLEGSMQPLSKGTLDKIIGKTGLRGQMTNHGFRAMARTMLSEVHRQRENVLEHGLAHGNGLATGVSYDRATHLEERAEIAQVWGTYLDKLHRQANGTTLTRVA